MDNPFERDLRQLAPATGATADPLFAATCGVVAILGAITLVAGTLIGGFMVPGHDPIADTVSDLAAGRLEWIQDISLYAFAGALLACALGGADCRLGRRRWSAGLVLLALLGLCVTVIGARDEYGDADTGGVVIHIYLVYALGAMFVLAPLALAHGLSRVWRPARRLSQLMALLWVIGAPLFFLVPTSIDGLVERLLGVVAVAWVSLFGALLIHAACAER